MCITSAILPADTVHNRMTFISICLQFKCLYELLPSICWISFLVLALIQLRSRAVAKMHYGLHTLTVPFLFCFLPLFVMKGRPGGASCLEPFQGTMWSSYNADLSPKGPAPSFGDVLSPAPPFSTCRLRLHLQEVSHTDFSLCVASHRWNY